MNTISSKLIVGILLAFACAHCGLSGSSLSGSGASEDGDGDEGAEDSAAGDGDSAAGDGDSAAGDGGAGAGDGDGDEVCQDGSEGCPCYDNGTCDDDLVCASNLCVDLSSTGDGDGDGAGGMSGDGDGDAPGGATGDGDGDRPGGPDCTTDPITGEEICTCISIASWGGLGTFGAVPGMDGQDAMVAWLNQNSTAQAEYFPFKPTITLEYLWDYDVILLQNLAGWTFTGDERVALQTWVEAGGGIISLAGYGGSAVSDGFNETNQLLSFSGMQYVGLADDGDISDQAFSECGFCLGNADVQGGFDPQHPIGAHVTAVGAFKGRSIDPGATGVVVATHQGLTAAAAADVGVGRVFMFHDEWVTYKSQWDGSGLSNDCTIEPNHVCAAYHPTLTFQIPQFWYNAIRWVSGDSPCFAVDDGGIVVQ